MEYRGINVIKSILPVDVNDITNFFIQKKGVTKLTLIHKSKLAIFDVSPANVIDEMILIETYFGESTSLLQKRRFFRVI